MEAQLAITRNEGAAKNLHNAMTVIWISSDCCWQYIDFVGISEANPE
jgi:hypothetical protein